VRSIPGEDCLPAAAVPTAERSAWLSEATAVPFAGLEVPLAGGIAAGLPAFAPNRLSRVGLNGKFPLSCAPSASLAETRTEFLEIGMAPEIARCDAAVMPPGARKFA
jgi:hypothetical protein